MYKKNAIGAGVLLICATILNVVGNNLYNPILDSLDYLSGIAANPDTVILGSLLVLLSAFACTGIAVGLYPVLRKHSESLALGSVTFRVIESVLYIVAVVSVLCLLPLSQEYSKAAASEASGLHASGTLLRAVDNWSGQLSVIAFAPAALMYYWIFYRSRMIPRWLSAWGLLAAVTTLVAALLGVFGQLAPFSAVFIVMQLPLAVQEFVLAGWLIVKGFSQPAVSLVSAETAPGVLPAGM